MNNIKGWIKTLWNIGFLQCLLIYNYKTFAQMEKAATGQFWLVRGLKFKAEAECQVFNTIWSGYNLQSCFPWVSSSLQECQRGPAARTTSHFEKQHSRKTGVKKKKQVFFKVLLTFFLQEPCLDLVSNWWLFLWFWLCTKKDFQGTALFLFSLRCTDGWCLLNSFNHISQWLHTCWIKCGKF